MPIEIKELIVRATIDPRGEDAKAEKKGEKSQKSVIAECVEQVLEILRKERER